MAAQRSLQYAPDNWDEVAMAGFRTHLATSTVVGLGYGAAGLFGLDLPWESCAIAAGLCSVSGLVPDLDSARGVPVRETLHLVAALAPLLLLPRLADWNLTHEQMALLGVATYLLTRWLVGGFFRRWTVHRGMWHSIPAALIAGLLTFWLIGTHEIQIRIFKSWAVVMGYLSHLILDEMYSVDFRGIRLRLKKSSGTALKLWGDRTWANLATYAQLLLLVVLVWFDPAVQAWLTHQGFESLAIARAWERWRDAWPDHSLVR